jgi:hypothetical protein
LVALKQPEATAEKQVSEDTLEMDTVQGASLGLLSLRVMEALADWAVLEETVGMDFT